MSFGNDLVLSTKEALEITKCNVAPAAINQHGQQSISVDDVTGAEAEALVAMLEASIKDK